MVAIKDYKREDLLSRYFFTEFSSLQVVLLSNIFQNSRLCLEKSKVSQVDSPYYTYSVCVHNSVSQILLIPCLLFPKPVQLQSFQSFVPCTSS